MKKFFLACFVLVGGFSALRAADGDLDTAFNPGGANPGMVIQAFPNGGVDEARGVAVQTDDKIVVVGEENSGAADSGLALARYLPNGSLDTSFGALGTGLVVTQVTVLTDAGNAVVIQSDGKIVVAGASDIGTASALNAIVARYNVDGTLDQAFGGNTFAGGGSLIGVAGFEFGTVDVANAVALQSDGKIVIAGSATIGGSTDFLVARYNTDGSLDTTFGAGFVAADFGAAGAIANAIAIQPDGKIVIGGQSETAAPKFGLMRFNSDGTLDTTFDGDGKVVTDIAAAGERIQDLFLQGDGKIVAVGFNAAAPIESFIVRYNTDGSLDTSFGTAGIVTQTDTVNDSIFNAVHLQPDGKIVSAGSQDPSDRFLLTRHTSTGAVDTTFGTSGIVLLPNLGVVDSIEALAIQADSKIIAVGNTDAGTTDFAVARLLNDSITSSKVALLMAKKYQVTSLS